jgi:hypothetical protein
MSIIVSDSGKEFEKPSIGMAQAVCRGVWDIGYQKGTWEGQEIIQPKIVVSWEIDELMTEGEYKGKRFTVNEFFTKSLSPKGKLRPALESWRGRPFTREELNGFDIEKLIGANCLLNLGENKKGKVVVLSVSPLMKNTVKMTPELPSTMPAWVQTIKDKAVHKEMAHVSEPERADGVDAKIGDVDAEIIPF